MAAKNDDRRRRFIDEYPVDLNATEAAKRAGYSAKTARQQGQRLLSNVDIRQAIDAKLLARSDRTQITSDSVLAELAKVAFSDMRRFAEWGPSGVKLLDSAGLADGAAACVAEV